MQMTPNDWFVFGIVAVFAIAFPLHMIIGRLDTLIKLLRARDEYR